MQQLGHGGIELALLSKTNSDAFLKVKEALKEALKEATSGEITDECLEELASNHCERLLCYQGEFAADDGDDGPQTFHALLSCLRDQKRWQSGAREARAFGPDARVPRATNACADTCRVGLVGRPSSKCCGTRTKRGKGFSLVHAPTLRATQPPTPSRHEFHLDWIQSEIYRHQWLME